MVDDDGALNNQPDGFMDFNGIAGGEWDIHWSNEFPPFHPPRRRFNGKHSKGSRIEKRNTRVDNRTRH